jgi:hypothetical protein
VIRNLYSAFTNRQFNAYFDAKFKKNTRYLQTLYSAINNDLDQRSPRDFGRTAELKKKKKREMSKKTLFFHLCQFENGFLN